MKKIIPLLFSVLLLSGCTWFQRGLDVCQEDSCFIELASEAQEKGETNRAREFCEAIISDTLKSECLETLTQ